MKNVIKYNKKIKKILKNIKIVVIRYSKSKNHLVLSMPCSNCQNLLENLGIKEVTYSTECGDITCEKICNMPSHFTKLIRSQLEK